MDELYEKYFKQISVADKKPFVMTANRAPGSMELARTLRELFHMYFI